MVIPFPAASAAPQPISTLLARCIGFLEGFEDDPAQRVTPLLAQLRQARQAELIALPAPPAAPAKFNDHIGYCFVGLESRTGGFLFARHDPNQEEHAGMWRWSAWRVDDHGHSWRTTGVAVMDDFGDLVEVST